MREINIATARAHAEAEGAGDMEATMNTLGPDPVYELLPMGRLLKGRDNARAYYEHFFANFAHRIAGYTLRAEWVTDEGLGQEYQMFMDGPGRQAALRHRRHPAVRPRRLARRRAHLRQRRALRDDGRPAPRAHRAGPGQLTGVRAGSNSTVRRSSPRRKNVGRYS